VLLDHPQVHVVHGLERAVLNRLKRQAMLDTDAMAVVAVDQHIAPHHQGIAAALGQDAALQGVVFIRGERVDVDTQLVKDLEVHGNNFNEGGQQGRAP
jgi:hypothetical protein